MNRLVLLCVFWTCAWSCFAAERKPNVLFIISDDHAWNDYGFMKHPHLATPALDRLAAQSLAFTRGYTPVPLCRPSLVSIVTGLYPHRHGVTGNDPALPEKGVNAMAQRLNPKYQRYYDTVVSNFSQRPNLVRDLTGRGDLALQAGKWWEGDPVRTAGFTHAMTIGTGKDDRHGGAGLTIGRKGLQPITEFIEAAGDKPWLVWYAPMLPHSPHTPPDDLLQKYLKLAPSEPVARYWACVEWFDRTCGELLGYLERRGLRDNTIVVYASDNGWIQDPKRPNQAAARSKRTPYEGGVRTPIMISWPAALKPRLDEEHLASTVDFWPTLAALLGTKAPADLPGINLADPAAVEARKVIFGEQYTHDIADVDQPTRSLEHRWMIDGWWKIIAPDPRNRPGEQPELYDLRADPWENRNLAGDDPGRLAAMLRRLDEHWKPQAE